MPGQELAGFDLDLPLMAIHQPLVMRQVQRHGLSLPKPSQTQFLPVTAEIKHSQEINRYIESVFKHPTISIRLAELYAFGASRLISALDLELKTRRITFHKE